jgi:hypothetical protein
MRIIPLKKIDAQAVCGSLTQTSKMPCKSSSLPTETCETGFRMAKVPGSICASCYADRGFYSMYQNTIKPAQFARWDAVVQACESDEAAELWVSGMVAMIGADQYFRHHDSGDLQGLRHLELIAELCRATPHTRHWLPTREYGTVKAYIEKHGRDALPENLIVRLSAMFPDRGVVIPASLRGIRNITASNVHTQNPIGTPCRAPEQKGECRDCRVCWTNETVSYQLH